jgi:hypothetical protein
MPDDLIFSNGIDVDTGQYAIDPMSAEELDALIRGVKAPDNINELSSKANTAERLGPKEGVDEKDLYQAGWGVIFADDADPAVEEALKPLLRLRESQTGKRYRRYTFRTGVDTKDRFLSERGMGPGPADPDVVPYYLLIAGGPDRIPFSFQSQLDVQYAVGRLHFESPAEYRTYAAGVVAAEIGAVRLPRQASFFGVRHKGQDVATSQSLEYLVEPLLKSVRNAKGWGFDPVLGLEATKEALGQRLGGAQTPALLFTASHGLRVRPNSPSGLSPAEHQGALICADWPGPGTKPKEERYFFAGGDLVKEPDANLQGLIALFFACFSGGTPKLDLYTRLQRLRLGQEPGPARELAPQPFVAGLPRRMLSAPAGGALAVVGHVEQSWPSSFVWRATEDGSLPPQTAAFESFVRRLMDGYPVGAAVEYLNSRYAELATMLQPFLEAIQFDEPYDRVEFANVWMAATDAQWYTVIGDPAVRLPVVDAEKAEPRPVLLSSTTLPADAGPANGGSGAAPEPDIKEDHMSATDPSDPRFDQSFTPPPASGELIELRNEHPDLYHAYVEHVKDGYRNNGRIFDDVRRAFMRSHYSTVVMYWILFAVGVGAVVTGIVMAAVQREVVMGAVFLGLGVAAFIGYFITRSTLSVEENLIYITWLGVIYNSYWTHLAWATERGTAQEELDKATRDALRELQKLVNRHARGTRERPNLGDAGDQPAPEARPVDAPRATPGAAG